MSRKGTIATVLVGAAYARLAWTVALDGTARRHHVEAAWFLLALAAVIAGVLLRTPQPEIERRSHPPWAGLTAVCLLASFALYWPALSLGFLSDDYVLLSAPLIGSWEFARPLPIALWRVLAPLVGPVGLHAVNIALHGLNAALVATLVGQLPFFHASMIQRWLAALLFLTFPAAVEPVAWCSGIFDVLCVTLALVYLMLAASAGPRARLTALIPLFLALLTKETAIVLPALLLLVRGRLVDRRLLTLSVTAVAVYASVRIMGPHPTPAAAQWEMYFFKELAGRPFAGLVLPWTRGELTEWPALVVALQLLAGAVVVAHALSGRALQAWTVAAWVLAAALPVFGLFFVSDLLEGSRYLYLPLTGWVLFVVLAIDAQPFRWWRPSLIVLMAALAVVDAFGVRAHLMPWRRAAALRDGVLSKARHAHDSAGCSASVFLNVPAGTDGAYVFRNGFDKAVQRPSPTTAGGTPCVFSWNGESFAR